MLSCIILYYTVLYNSTSITVCVSCMYCIVSHCIITVSYCNILHHTLSYCVTLHYIIVDYIILYFTILRILALSIARSPSRSRDLSLARSFARSPSRLLARPRGRSLARSSLPRRPLLFLSRGFAPGPLARTSGWGTHFLVPFFIVCYFSDFRWGSTGLGLYLIFSGVKFHVECTQNHVWDPLGPDS